jgi:hypothetical protein
VLEYLLYGSLLTNVTDESHLRKLVIDSDFYLLPKLKAQATAQLQQIKHKEDKPVLFDNASVDQVVCIKLDSASLGGSGQFWQWGRTQFISSSHFTLSTSSYNNDTITILKNGTYLVQLRTAVNNSQNGTYLSLRVNGTDVARSYNCFNTNYPASFYINEIFNFNDGDDASVSNLQ